MFFMNGSPTLCDEYSWRLTDGCFIEKAASAERKEKLLSQKLQTAVMVNEFCTPCALWRNKFQVGFFAGLLCQARCLAHHLGWLSTERQRLKIRWIAQSPRRI
jgi:hypothetical protein